ncbi:MAG: hypoxanthine phosphoribosyltransferase [candidate division Zixibacteria bacterium HGW-Zixibacteria-1]|nr:MAG: hypoxanthine phosphoribosyltransferase [candidate division Zixibacteria bacterium HGW-Zixibacteria-1]
MKSPELQKFELLLPQDKIAQAIKRLGKQISRDYKNREPIMIGILKGCIVFMADLIRNISIPIEVEFISATSYSNGQTRDEKVDMYGGPDTPLAGRHLLIVEGVVDSGRTAQTIIKQLKKQEPASIEIVTLLDKSKCRQVDIDIKYRGFDVGDDFVIGFGLDESQKYRNLPFIGKVINE